MTQQKDDAATGMVPIGPKGDQAEDLGPGTELQEWNAEVLASVPGLKEAFLQMLEHVPGVGEDAAARIVAQVLAAETVEDLDAPWNAEGMREWVDTVVTIHDCHKMPSDYAGGLGVYLVCDVQAPGSDEKFVLTTGSVSIVAQLVRAYVLGKLPLSVTPRKSDKPTKNGFFPMHLELVRQARRARPQVIDQTPAQPTRQEQSRRDRQARILDEARAAGPVEG